MIIMSIDCGDVRTGVAVCDKNEILASPVTVITERDKPRLATLAAEEAKRCKAQLIVVGLPKNMDGSEGFRAKECRDFASLLEEASGIETVLYDERLTTVSAHHALNATDTRGKKRKAVVDAVSAVMILEDFIASRKNSRG